MGTDKHTHSTETETIYNTANRIAIPNKCTTFDSEEISEINIALKSEDLQAFLKSLLNMLVWISSFGNNREAQVYTINTNGKKF